jgi:hypothetical protein
MKLFQLQKNRKKIKAAFFEQISNEIMFYLKLCVGRVGIMFKRLSKLLRMHLLNRREKALKNRKSKKFCY